MEQLYLPDWKKKIGRDRWRRPESHRRPFGFILNGLPSSLAFFCKHGACSGQGKDYLVSLRPSFPRLYSQHMSSSHQMLNRCCNHLDVSTRKIKKILSIQNSSPIASLQHMTFLETVCIFDVPLYSSSKDTFRG